MGFPVTGTAADETLIGSGGDDTIDGMAGDDVLIGGGGNDVFDLDYGTITGAAAGIDIMEGGTGDDVYFVDNTQDVVVELSGEGTDTVFATANYTLFGNIEILVLDVTGTATYGAGNNLDNTLFGNDLGDTLDGGAGVDTLNGGTGNDTYIVDDINDVVNETDPLPAPPTPNTEIDTVISSVDWDLGANALVENLTLTGTNSIHGLGNALDNAITGNAGNNILTGLAGNDTLDGGAGADQMTGGSGDDIYFVDNVGDLVTEAAGEGNDEVFSTITYTLTADVEKLILLGTSRINGTTFSTSGTIIGNSAVNTLTGLGGDDILDGGVGADTMIGGAGNDVYFIDNAGDRVTEAGGNGTDTIVANTTHILEANVENLTLGGTSAINGTGNSEINVIVGNSASNTLDGGINVAGVDTLIGGGGNDLYIVRNLNDYVDEIAGQGTDTVQAGFSYTLTTNVENLTLTGSAAINGTGNTFNNIIIGNAGNNSLDGATGADTMSGGNGSDTYFIDNAGDVAIEISAGSAGGTDTVISGLSFTLGANIENLVLTGTADITGTGNTLANVIDASGASGDDTLDGGGGADALIGGLGNTTFILHTGTEAITAGAGANTVASSLVSLNLTNYTGIDNVTLLGSLNLNATGDGNDNVVTGNDGNNTLNGGAGIDTIDGGLGNDTIIVDSTTDIITDLGGTDTIFSSVTFDLSTTSGIENLTLGGTLAINGTGDAGNNVIMGNSSDNNTLDGGAGNDTLDGKGGADTMYGGAGNDTFFVDRADDVIIELVGGGTDTIIVASGVTYAGLPANVEVKIMAGSSSGSLTGGAGDDTLVGNAGSNILDGGSGADTMSGGKGNDTYRVDDTGDLIIENAGEGTDKIIATAGAALTFYSMQATAANVENFALVSTTADFTLVGNIGDNLLVTSSGNDTINGFGGHDTMNGGYGNDTYVAELGDIIIDAGGHDTIITNNHYTLQNNLEDLIVFDPNSIETEFYAKGNAANNLIDGSNLTEDYTLLGLGGRDTLIGGTGSDSLDGGVNSDIMSGGLGDDTFFADNTGDVVNENPDAGTDILQVKALTYVLLATSEIEEINLTATTGQHVTASDTDNTVTGGSFNDSIDAGGGDDTIYGGGGTDVIRGGTGQDTFILKFDTAFSHLTYIWDFNLSDTGNLGTGGGPSLGDVLDIGDILSHASGTGHVEPASDWVRLVDHDHGTLVQIDLDGAGTVSHFQTVAVLQNIQGLTAEVALLLSGNLEDGGFFA